MKKAMMCCLVLITILLEVPVFSSGIAFGTERFVNSSQTIRQSLRLNSSAEGTFFLTYVDFSENMLECFTATWNTYGTRDVTDLSSAPNGSTAMAFGNDYPLALFIDINNTGIQYCTYENNIWSDPTPIPGIDNANSLAADYTGRAHIAWARRDSGGSDLMYSTWIFGWKHELVARLSEDTMNPYFDVKYSQYDGMPHIVWFSREDSSIYHATRVTAEDYDIEVAYSGVTDCEWIELDFLQAVPIISFLDTSSPAENVLRALYHVGDWYDDEVFADPYLIGADMAVSKDEVFTTFHWYYVVQVSGSYLCLYRSPGGWSSQNIPLSGNSQNTGIQAEWDANRDRLGVAVSLLLEDKIVFMDGYEYTPTPRPATPTPTSPPGQPTNTPPLPTATPTTHPTDPTHTPPAPTSTPAGGMGSVEIVMPDTTFSEGESCFCRVTYSMPSQVDGLPLFVLLDVYGSYYFWPDFTSELSYKVVNPGPVPVTVDVIPEFNWPADISPASNITWWGALTNSEMTALLSDPVATFTFGWN